MPEPFTGFSEEGLQFLARLARNNNREWFNPRKEVFKEHVEEPAVRLVAALGKKLQRLSPGISYDTRATGAGSLMRIYRDIRFSKDKTPYHTSVRMVFWEGKSKKDSLSGIYVGIDPRSVGVFVGNHGFDKRQLARYRKAVGDDKSGKELERTLAKVRKAGDYEVGGSHYKRVPAGFEKDHPRAELLKHNGLYAHASDLPADQAVSPTLVDVIVDLCRDLMPVHHWLVKTLGK